MRACRMWAVASLFLAVNTSVSKADDTQSDANTTEIRRIVALQGEYKTDKQLPGNPVVELSFNHVIFFEKPDLSFISQLKHLRRLSLWGIPEGRPFAFLKDLPELEFLDISNTESDDDELDHVVDCAKLRSLHLTGNKITDAGLHKLNKLRNLEELWLWSTSITDEGVAALRVHKNLTFLGLPVGITDTGLLSLRSFPKLRELTLNKSNVTDKGLGELKYVPHLEVLELFTYGPYGSGLARDCKVVGAQRG